MVTKVATKSKESREVAKAHWQCMSCGSDFWGAKKNPHCPQCKAEGFDLRELNEDGIPIETVKNVVAGGAEQMYDAPNTILQSPQKPKIDIDLSRAAISKADEISADMFERDMAASIQDSYLSRVKAKAAGTRAEQIEAENHVKSLEGPTNAEEGYGMPGMPNQNSMSASTLIQSISDLPEEQREWWLDQIKNPQTVYGLATLLNPPKQTMQGNIPSPQQANPLLNLMAMKQQMGDTQMAPQTPQAQGGEETSSMLEMAEALKIMFDMAKSSIPTPVDPSESNKDLKDALLELKESQEKLNDRYMALRIEQAEGGGGGGGITREDLEALMDSKMQSLAKTPIDALKDARAMIEEMDKFKEVIGPKDTVIPGEPLDEWVKKHTLERELQQQQMAHDELLASKEAKTAKWQVAKMLLGDGIKDNLKARTKEQETDTDNEEEETAVPTGITHSKVALVR